jgi:hypothetical protein
MSHESAEGGPRIWPCFLASSGVGPCDVPLSYASGPTPRQRGKVARWHAHLRGLATSIHETSGLKKAAEVSVRIKEKSAARWAFLFI